MDNEINSMIKKYNEAKENGRFLEALQYAKQAYSICPVEETQSRGS